MLFCKAYLIKKLADYLKLAADKIIFRPWRYGLTDEQTDKVD